MVVTLAGDLYFLHQRGTYMAVILYVYLSSLKRPEVTELILVLACVSSLELTVPPSGTASSQNHPTSTGAGVATFQQSGSPSRSCSFFSFSKKLGTTAILSRPLVRKRAQGHRKRTSRDTGRKGTRRLTTPPRPWSKLASSYRGGRLIKRDWHCGPCRHPRPRNRSGLFAKRFSRSSPSLPSSGYVMSRTFVPAVF
jgi:hypothetical protein